VHASPAHPPTRWFKPVAASRHKAADELPDAGQDGLLIAREGPVIGAVELDEAGLGDVAGEMPAGRAETPYQTHIGPL